MEGGEDGKGGGRKRGGDGGMLVEIIILIKTLEEMRCIYRIYSQRLL